MICKVPFVTTNVYTSRLDSPITAPLHTDRFDSFIMQTEAAMTQRGTHLKVIQPKVKFLDGRRPAPLISFEQEGE